MHDAARGPLLCAASRSCEARSLCGTDCCSPGSRLWWRRTSLRRRPVRTPLSGTRTQQPTDLLQVLALDADMCGHHDVVADTLCTVLCLHTVPFASVRQAMHPTGEGRWIPRRFSLPRRRSRGSSARARGTAPSGCTAAPAATWARHKSGLRLGPPLHYFALCCWVSSVPGQLQCACRPATAYVFIISWLAPLLSETCSLRLQGGPWCSVVDGLRLLVRHQPAHHPAVVSRHGPLLPAVQPAGGGGKDHVKHRLG